MSVKVNVRYFLPHLTHDQDVVEVSGGTVGECLDDLVNRFPELRKWVYDKNGDLTNFIDVYVNLERSMPEELSNPVREGDELFIVMMLSGG